MKRYLNYSYGRSSDLINGENVLYRIDILGNLSLFDLNIKPF